MSSRTKRARAKTPRTFERTDRPQEKRGFFDFFRFGESYTSLVLGIVVVIITAILLVSFVRNRNIGQISDQNRDIATISTVQGTPTPEVTGTVTVSPTRGVTMTATPTRRPTVSPTRIPTATPRAAAVTTRPTATVTSRPTATVTRIPTATKAPTATKSPTATVTRAATPTRVPTQIARPTTAPTQIALKGREYTVGAGDNLWSIAERAYKSGYNWVDIANANKLTNPGNLTVGQKLILPMVETRTVQKTTELKPQDSVTGKAITGTTYTVVRGDYLWDIAIRAYGTGFKWADIAKANKITNPNVILPGSRLTIPR